MKLSELISTYIQLSFTTSIETKVGNTYTCEGIKNVKRLKHIQERNRDFEAITKKFYIKDGVWRSVLCTNDRSVKVYTGKEVDKICPSCVNAVKSISRHRTPILYESDFHYSFNQLKETFFSLIKNCGSDFDTSHVILSIARALHEMKDTVKEKDLLSKSKPFRYENDGESYCVMFCRGYEIGDKFRCNTLIRTKSSHWKQMDKFCAFCNQNNWKETKKKIKRDTEDKEAKRRRIEFTNLINASPETLKEKIVGKNVTIKELRKQLGLESLRRIHECSFSELGGEGGKFSSIVKQVFKSSITKEVPIKNLFKDTMLDCIKNSNISTEVTDEQILSTVNETIDFAFLNIRNVFDCIVGKKRQVRYSEAIMSMFVSVFAQNSGALNVIGNSNFLRVPSRRTIKNAIGKSMTLVNDDDSSLYMKIPVGNGIGVLLSDDIYVKKGLAFQSKTNEFIGVCLSRDLKSCMKEIMHGNLDKELTCAYTQWAFRSIRNDFYVLSFFPNDGTLSSDEILRQYLYVLLRLSARGITVVVMCSTEDIY